ncbi:helix-turn-helix domain-containing protein [Streptomyces sp. H27-H1]|uniref:TetR/AcrR family transcriptional regulator n=1 Tax=Streptomyces sp. H27-H1 TaxID=2996461 RepID=UPI002D1E34CF|nr:helix-turn-helix domain-containing protein [Streptomyces sp. H27-H1]
MRRTAVLDAAETLFAERGYRGTSVRAITDLAGANLAAVGHHFGSKAELLAAVARRVIEPINAAQCAGLDRLLALTPDPPVTEPTGPPRTARPRWRARRPDGGRSRS